MQLLCEPGKIRHLSRQKHKAAYLNEHEVLIEKSDADEDGLEGGDRSFTLRDKFYRAFDHGNTNSSSRHLEVFTVKTPLKVGLAV